MKHLNATTYANKGFTLVEMAIVLAIVALLLGGLLPVISSQVEQQRRNETRKYIDEVRDALLGYAIAHKHLPCPDTDSDGIENRTGTSCTQQVGTLPHKDVGVTDKDAYGTVLAFAVTLGFADSATPFALTTAGTMVICPSAATCPATYLANNAIAVIVSRGANWATASSPDETENTNGDTKFVSHDFVQNGFDDLVVWLSPNTLFNRMVAAGQLP